MCGIAGWYRRGGRPVGAGAVRAQCDAIRHRGPDDDGVLVDGDFGFGMRRLSILDIAGGHQPMANVGHRHAIVFNGEIFNHRVLRAELTVAGYPFTSHSDTETILAGFTVWGNAVWAKLEGMFAVAVWDRTSRTLTLARDPLGIKPLYVSEQAGGLSFASELKALRLLPEHDFTIDERAVADYFRFGHVRRPRSIFREVATVDPGHYLTIGADGASVATRYWQPRFRASERMSPGDWTDQMRSMLLATTARHMQADVPVAAFLSGGIDSSAVLAAMVRATSQPIKAFTIGHPGHRIDETDAAARIARHLGCEHIAAPLTVDDAAACLPQIQACYDEPFADMAAIPTWFASKLAAAEVKVVLCGEGGDELFAGYKRHRNALAIERNRGLIGAAGPLIGMFGRLPATGSARLNTLRQHASRFAEFARLPDGYQQFFAATQISGSAVRQAVMSKSFQTTSAATDGFAALEQEYFGQAPRNLSALEQFMFADLTLNLPSDMLTRLDRASMAHSLEARVPFLSHVMVDWALTVPTELKLRGHVGKRILRTAVAPWLPVDILKRPKQGFQIPMASWLRGDFGRMARETWDGSGAASSGFFDDAAIERLFADHRAGRADHARMLYALTMFSLWWGGARQDHQRVAADAA